MKILVKTRTVCDFCSEGEIELDNGLTMPCYRCDGVGFSERWDDLEALINLLLFGYQKERRR